jgi:hypothetical protein
MSIVISTSGTIDIENYDGLIAFVIEHLELDAETAEQVPTFIRLAEYKLNRMLRSLDRETSAPFATTAGVRYVALPPDYVDAVLVTLDGDALRQVSYSDLVNNFATGEAPAYAISEGAIQFGPVPAAAVNGTLVYMAKLANLSAATQTNWLITDHADAYLYATLIQAEAFLGHDERLPLLASALAEVIDEINAYAVRQRFSGPLVPKLAFVP